MTNKSISTLTGADLLISILKKHGVDTIFSITGAGNLAIIDAIVRDGSISLIFSHHEQAAVIEAQGYSRISGKLGVALVTTGGGTSNAITGILSAQLDSIPILLISGNESSFHCENINKLRAFGVQGFDSVSVFKPIVKSSKRIMKVNQIQNIVESLIQYALTPRMGPTHLDFPMDLQRKIIDEDLKQEPIEFQSFFSQSKVNLSSQVKFLFDSLIRSKRPMLYVGNGCRNDKISTLLKSLINKFEIPFLLSWSALDLFPEEHPLNMGRVGIYGDRASNILLQKADLVLCLGTRLAIPQVGYELNDFGRYATKWVVDLDETECLKFQGPEWKVINCGLFEFFTTLEEASAQYVMPSFQDWLMECEQIWIELPRKMQIGSSNLSNSHFVHSTEVIDFLNENAQENATFVTDVGAGLLSGHYMFEAKAQQRFFTSQGLGEMGFGLPGAIGAYFAAPDRQIICLNTDGGIMFNLQELQLIPEYKIPLKLFIFNNSGYAMIKISQDNLFDSRIVGSSTSTGISFPSFQKISDAFGFNYFRIDSQSQLSEELKRRLQSPNPELIEIIMDPQQKYLPRLSTNRMPDGTLVSPPLEDLSPLLDIHQLERFLGSPVHKESLKARIKL